MLMAKSILRNRVQIAQLSGRGRLGFDNLGHAQWTKLEHLAELLEPVAKIS